MLRGIDDLTIQELSVMTEEDLLEKILPVEMMKRGIVLMEQPESLKVKPIERDKVFWEVSCTSGYSNHTFDCVFSTEAEAKNFIGLNPIPLRYGDTEPESLPDDYKVGKKLFYSREKKAKHKADIELAERLRKENENAWKQYQSIQDEYNELRSHLLGQHRTAVRKMQKASELAATFTEYTKMTDGNEKLAMEFLSKSAYASDWEWFLEHLELAGIALKPEYKEQEDGA